MRCLQTLTLSGLVLVLAVGPLAAQPRGPATRVWTQVDGRVERIDGTQATLKTDSGRRLRVDLSNMPLDDRTDLTVGARAALIGYLAPQGDEFVAWFLPVDRPDVPVAASPRTEPADGRTWRVVQGRVAGVEGTTLLLRTDDGTAVPVDVAAVDEAVRRTLMPNERITVIGFSQGPDGRFEGRFIDRAARS